jgi:hypothetical protein
MAGTRAHGNAGTVGNTGTAGTVGGPKTGVRRRGRQRMSTARTLGAGGSANIDAIVTQWQQAGLVDPNEIPMARKYAGLTLITLGVNG